MFLRSFLAASLFLGSLLPAHAVRVVGTDLLAGALSEPLTAAAARAGVDLQMEFPGSLLATDALASGQADVAIVAIPDGQDLPGAGFIVEPLAFQVAVVAVHANNPVEAVSIPQLTAVFGVGGTLNITEWGQLGAPGSWTSRKIGLAAVRRNDSVALELFKSRIIPDRPIASNITYFADSRSLLNRIPEDDTLMAILSSPGTVRETRLLAISEREGETAYSPSSDNVLFGDYPLRLPFYIVINQATASPDTLAIIEILYSDALATALESLELMPLSNRERLARIAEIRDAIK